MHERGDVRPGLLCTGGEELLNGSVQLLPVYIESYRNPIAAPGKPSLTLSDDWIGSMLSKPAQLRGRSPPAYTCPPIIISSDLITAIMWFSASPEHLLSFSSTAWKSIILVYSLSCSNSIRNTSHQYAPS